MGGSNDFQWKQRRASRLIQSLKGGGDGRILTATYILQNLMGGSGRLNFDTTKILRTPFPLRR